MSGKRGRPPSKSDVQAKGNKKQKVETDYSIYEDMANQIRIDTIRAVHVSKSGHPTSSSSIADILTVLFFHEEGLKIDTKNHSHFLNDRLVLSKGHAAPGLYAAFYRAGLITEQELLSLRLKDSIIEGHPVPKIPFVDVASGSLGQGLGVAAGMAYSSKYFDKIDNKIYCILGDGQSAEGSVWEAAAFSSYYKLNNLIAFVDVNSLGQSQQTMYLHNTNVFVERFKAFGCNTLSIDGHSYNDLVSALSNAHKNKDSPTVIICKTEKGKNFTPQIESQQNWHGKDLGTKTQGVLAYLKSLIKHQKIEWKTFLPNEEQIKKYVNKERGTVSVKPNYEKGKLISTRKAYGNGLLKAYQSNHNVIGLDGDTKNSTFSTTLHDKYPDNFIECFIAEQNMISVATGLSCRNKIAFCSTFACFLIRAGDQIRIAAISSSKLKMVGSHSGVSIGEDGPSQMALEDVAFFRTLPNGIVLIPSDGVSIEKAVQLAGNYNDGPSFIRTARPDVPIIYENDEPFELGKFKTFKQSPNDKAVIIGASVTTHEAIKAAEILQKQGISVRVIDIFSLKPIDAEGLIKSIGECGGNLVVVEEHYEAGGVFEAVVGAAFSAIKKAEHLCVRKIPGSAKPEEQLEIYGLDSKHIAAAVKKILGQ